MGKEMMTEPACCTYLVSFVVTNMYNGTSQHRAWPSDLAIHYNAASMSIVNPISLDY